MELSDLLQQGAEPVTESGCVIWTGRTINSGHGIVHCQGKSELAHRAAWIVAHGPIPPKMYICHHCDVRCCINPGHLFIGTQSDNMWDAARKGKLSFPKPLAMRLAMSKARTGVSTGPHSPEWNAAISRAHKGKKKSLEHRAKIIEQLKQVHASKVGISLTPEHRAKVGAGIRAAWQRRREQQR